MHFHPRNAFYRFAAVAAASRHIRCSCLATRRKHFTVRSPETADDGHLASGRAAEVTVSAGKTIWQAVLSLSTLSLDGEARGRLIKCSDSTVPCRIV